MGGGQGRWAQVWLPWMGVSIGVLLIAGPFAATAIRSMLVWTGDSPNLSFGNFINLFTDSIVALELGSGKLRWYFQQTHHDVWDYDSGNPPILFDMMVRGQRVKALAEASKNGFLYILNRETGESFTGPGLIVHLIREHHFFEGKESPYRVEPEKAVRVLELQQS